MSDPEEKGQSYKMMFSYTSLFQLSLNYSSQLFKIGFPAFSKPVSISRSIRVLCILYLHCSE
jgi:hypothetical protein